MIKNLKKKRIIKKKREDFKKLTYLCADLKAFNANSWPPTMHDYVQIRNIYTNFIYKLI